MEYMFVTAVQLRYLAAVVGAEVVEANGTLVHLGFVVIRVEKLGS